MTRFRRGGTRGAVRSRLRGAARPSEREGACGGCGGAERGGAGRGARRMAPRRGDWRELAADPVQSIHRAAGIEEAAVGPGHGEAGDGIGRRDEALLEAGRSRADAAGQDQPSDPSGDRGGEGGAAAGTVAAGVVRHQDTLARIRAAEAAWRAEVDDLGEGGTTVGHVGAVRIVGQAAGGPGGADDQHLRVTAPGRLWPLGNGGRVVEVVPGRVHEEDTARQHILHRPVESCVRARCEGRVGNTPRAIDDLGAAVCGEDEGVGQGGRIDVIAYVVVHREDDHPALGADTSDPPQVVVRRGDHARDLRTVADRVVQAAPRTGRRLADREVPVEEDLPSLELLVGAVETRVEHGDDRADPAATDERPGLRGADLLQVPLLAEARVVRDRRRHGIEVTEHRESSVLDRRVALVGGDGIQLAPLRDLDDVDVDLRDRAEELGAEALVDSGLGGCAGAALEGHEDAAGFVGR